MYIYTFQPYPVAVGGYGEWFLAESIALCSVLLAIW